MTSPVVACHEGDSLRPAMDADLSRKLLIDSMALQAFVQELTEA